MQKKRFDKKNFKNTQKQQHVLWYTSMISELQAYDHTPYLDG